MSRIILTTARLQLRPTTDADAEDLYSLEQDPEVMRFLNGGRPTPRRPPAGEAQPFLTPRGGEPGVWAAFETGSGAFIGWFSLRRAGAEAALGYRLRRQSWGRGYASEGAAALLEFGFESLGLARITAETMAVNLRSRRVMARLGMQYVRTIHGSWPDPLPGSEEGEVEYAITREAWARRKHLA